MTKQEVLNQITKDAVELIKIENAELDKDGSPIVHTLPNGRTMTKYNANVAAKEGEGVQVRNIPFIVFNEGEADEEAYITQNAKAPQPDAARQAVTTYLDSQPYIRYQITEVNEEGMYARARAIKDNGDNTASEVNLFIWKDAGEAIMHLELTE